MMRKLTALLFGLIAMITNVKGQDGEAGSEKTKGGIISIEPRNYVTIYEYRHDKRKGKQVAKPIKLWELSEVPEDSNVTDMVPAQKHELIDPRSRLEIRFNHQKLIHDLNFHGNLSLTATADGEPIQVSPYSMVGKEQTAYGVRAKSPLELADYLLNLVIEARRFKSLHAKHGENMDGWRSENNDKAKDAGKKKLVEKLNSALAHLTASGSTNSNLGLHYYPLLEDIDYIRKKVRSPYLDNIIENRWNPYRKPAWLKEELDSLKAEAENDSTLKPEIPKKDIREYVRTLDRIFNYLVEIRLSGQKTVDASLQILGIPATDFDATFKIIKDDLREVRAGLGASNYEWQVFHDADDGTLAAKLVAISEAVLELGYVRGTLAKLLEGNYGGDFIKEGDVGQIFQTYSNVEELTEAQRPEESSGLNFQKQQYEEDLHQIINDDSSSLRQNEEDLDMVRRGLAIEAAKHIYRDLVYATIDLEKVPIENLSKLEISVVWYNRTTSDTTVASGTKLGTARFRIKNSGWKLGFPESALLIKRINQDLLSDNYPLSPSNFKPTAGISMTWGYHTDKRGGGFVRFCKWLEPSFGFNVSYLDFDSTKDFEIGAGPIVGLWDDKVFFTGGYNFMATGQSPFYWGIGFSFSKTATWIKEQATK